jgi:type IV secretory pathway VirB6-like protein
MARPVPGPPCADLKTRVSGQTLNTREMKMLKQLRKFWRADFLSPKDMLVRAAAIAVVFLIAHLAGLREFTSVLNGTVGSIELGWGGSAFFGVSYILLYLASILFVPILVIAAAISAVLQKLLRSKLTPDESRTNTAPPN